MIRFYTTLKILRSKGACKDRYKHLKSCLDKNTGDNSQIPVEAILEYCGVSDTLWLIFNGAVPKHQQADILLIGKWAVYDFAGHVFKYYEKRYPKDKRVQKCVWATKKYLKGEISKDELRIYRAAAYAAAAAAADAAAHDAAYAAAADAAAADAAADAAYAAAAADADAAYAAAAAERKWQARQLLKRLGEK